jgi:ketosteroid isomerase-like protein
MTRGDGEAVLAGLADDVMFVTPQEQDDAIITYVGTKIGKAAVTAAFAERARIVETVSADVGEICAQGDRAWVSITTRERYLPTGREFTIEAAHQFQLAPDGRIRRWRAFFDPNPEVDVLRAALDTPTA